MNERAPTDEQIRATIEERLRELRPVVAEVARLEAALEALGQPNASAHEEPPPFYNEDHVAIGVYLAGHPDMYAVSIGKVTGIEERRVLETLLWDEKLGLARKTGEEGRLSPWDLTSAGRRFYEPHRHGSSA